MVRNPWVTALLGLVVGVGIGAGAVHFLAEEEGETAPVIPAVYMDSAQVSPSQKEENTSVEAVNPSYTSETIKIMQLAFTVASLLEQGEYEALSSFVHPEKGVRFTPYSTVDFQLDRVLTGQQLKTDPLDDTVHHWGIQDGSGFPLTLTTAEYFAQFVVPMKYTMAPYVALDTVLISGNSLENITEAYPEGHFVDFSFRGIDPDFGGIDWSSLKLVFEPVEDSYFLVGVVRGQWTI